MIIKASSGMLVSLVDTDGKSLFDKNGTEWARYGGGDNVVGRLACYRNIDNGDMVMLEVTDLLRTVAGKDAMLRPCTLDEMVDHISRCPKYIKDRVADWPNQKLMEVLIESDEKNVDPRKLIEKEVERMIEHERQAEEERRRAEQPTEAPEKSTEAPKDRGTYRRVPRPRKQEGSVSVGLEDTAVLLTPKQLEFMERLSECPGWNNTGVTGEYVASEYAQELSDTMNPMSVGAVLTTLREKHLLHTEKCRVGGVKCCKFTLTDLGTKVYNKLANKEEQK